MYVLITLFDMNIMIKFLLFSIHVCRQGRVSVVCFENAF